MRSSLRKFERNISAVASFVPPFGCLNHLGFTLSRQVQTSKAILGRGIDLHHSSRCKITCALPFSKNPSQFPHWKKSTQNGTPTLPAPSKMIHQCLPISSFTTLPARPLIHPPPGFLVFPKSLDLLFFTLARFQGPSAKDGAYISTRGQIGSRLAW